MRQVLADRLLRRFARLYENTPPAFCTRRRLDISRRRLATTCCRQNHIALTWRDVALARPTARRQSLSYSTQAHSNENHWGPLDEYEARVQAGRLRDDEHQRHIVQALQDLHDMLVDYEAPKIMRPDSSSSQSQSKSVFKHGAKGSWWNWLFGLKVRRQRTVLPDNLPRGLYMFGDVGSGKTMLMDMFYDTLPHNVRSKTRIHFHNFMQDVHHQLHRIKQQNVDGLDAIKLVAWDIAAKGSVLCFDEFQCTDVADAMILRSLLESIMSYGVVLVTTSNRHPDDLYKNGIQRASFVPCINLLKNRLRVLNLDSAVDYRKIPRPPSGVYHHPLDKAARSHADKWFRFLGNFTNDPPRPRDHDVWGRTVHVPSASGEAARFKFDELLRSNTSAADFLELARRYHAFIVTDVPGLTLRDRDVARRFITFVDAIYESRAKLVLTTARPLQELFLSAEEMDDALAHDRTAGGHDHETPEQESSDDVAGQMLENVHLSMSVLKRSRAFQQRSKSHSINKEIGGNSQETTTGNISSESHQAIHAITNDDEEVFAISRALSRLSEMASQEWVERGLGMQHRGGLHERESWKRQRASVLDQAKSG